VSYPWLSLQTANALKAEAKRRGVSKVARGEVRSSQTREGFMQAYAAVKGSKAAMARRMATTKTSWAQRREGFIARHVAQGGPWWETVGGAERPTRRHLGLIMWAYSPTPAKLKRYIAQGAKRNPAQHDLVDDYAKVQEGAMSVGAFARRYGLKHVRKLPMGRFSHYDCGSHVERRLDQMHGRGRWRYGRQIDWQDAQAGDQVVYGEGWFQHYGILVDPENLIVESCWGVDGECFQHPVEVCPYQGPIAVFAVEAR
jgi:hypothetical protein